MVPEGSSQHLLGDMHPTLKRQAASCPKSDFDADRRRYGSESPLAGCLHVIA